VASEPTRYFEVAEAEALLPELDRLLSSAQMLFGRLEQVRRRLSHASQTNGHVGVARSTARGSDDEARSISEQLGSLLRQIEAQGVLVRDIETGLIDFPSIRNGEPVFLCWRRGEPLRIEWWHPIATGIAGRQRLL
jgi:hypothetical protein